MINSILSEAANAVLDLGLTAALGPESVKLTDETFERIERMMEDHEIRWNLMPQLSALCKRVRVYVNGGGRDQKGLRRILEDSLDLSEKLAAHSTHRDAVQPYQLAKAIHVKAIERTLKLGLSGASKQDLSDAGLDAVNQTINFERDQRHYMTHYTYAAFKYYSLTSRASANWYRRLPRETRSLNPDPMSWLGSRYREVTRGFRKHMGRREGELVARPHYLMKMVKPKDLALEGPWINAEPGGFYRCHGTRDGFVPIGDACAPDNVGPWGVPQIKPLRRKPRWVESWKKSWDDRSANKDGGYRGGPWAFWTPETPRGWSAIGHMIEKVDSREKPVLRRPRIQMFPDRDLEEADGDSFADHWTDSGSGADEDVCAHRVWPKSEFFDDTRRDGILITSWAGGPETPVPWKGHSWNREQIKFRWIKKELLDGY